MREKYIFDSDNLTFVEEKQTFARFFKRCGKFSLAAFVVGGAVWSLSYFNMIPSVNSLLLQHESDACISNIQQLDMRFEKIEAFLSEIQSHDDKKKKRDAVRYNGKQRKHKKNRRVDARAGKA